MNLLKWIGYALTWIRCHPETFANAYLWTLLGVLLILMLTEGRKQS